MVAAANLVEVAALVGDTAPATMSMGHIVFTDEGGEVTSSRERFLSAFDDDLYLMRYPHP